jgi:hypothetical protein
MKKQVEKLRSSNSRLMNESLASWNPLGIAGAGAVGGARMCRGSPIAPFVDYSTVISPNAPQQFSNMPPYAPVGPQVQTQLSSFYTAVCVYTVYDMFLGYRLSNVPYFI